MNNLNVARRIVVCSCSLTPRQWELYESEQSDQVAQALNQAVVLFAAGAGSSQNFLKLMHDLMDRFSEVGASDTEPRAVLRQIARELYDDQSDSSSY